MLGHRSLSSLSTPSVLLECGPRFGGGYFRRRRKANSVIASRNPLDPNDRCPGSTAQPDDISAPAAPVTGCWPSLALGSAAGVAVGVAGWPASSVGSLGAESVTVIVPGLASSGTATPVGLEASRWESTNA